MSGRGRIPDREVAAVRERARIDEIVGQYVTLARAGADSMKGLCPFHEEKSPSFHVRPGHGHFHCFGCQEGGDVFAFVMKVEHLTFPESVERVAERVGYQVRYEGGGPSAAPQRKTRSRLIAANAAAAQFYAEQLATAPALTARTYLAERNFEAVHIEQFGCGFAPTSWDSLTKHLLQSGFSIDELVEAGLSKQGRRGPIDRFRGRLLWPIRSISGDVVGFGARRVFDDDPIDAKYLNTSETPLYKKSHTLFGLDRARRSIATSHQVVVVEGYTDVMAMHAAGITTAVAACGTAFGDSHLTQLRRVLLDDSSWRAEIVYLFDGDAAGIAAATKAFAHSNRSAGRSSVALVPNGQDPCELRQTEGDEAVRSLLAARTPLPDFVFRTAIAEHDLTGVDGRVAAMRHTGTLLVQITDPAERSEYSRQISSWIGVDPETLAAYARTEKQPAVTPDQPRTRAASPSRTDDRVALQRSVLQAALQAPTHAAASGFDAIPGEAFTDQNSAALRQAIADSGGTSSVASDPQGWVARLKRNLGAQTQLATELIVEPLPVTGTGTGNYVAAIVAKLHALHLTDRIETLRGIASIGSRTRGPSAELSGLEQTRRELYDRYRAAVGTPASTTQRTPASTATRDRRRPSPAASNLKPRGPRL